MARVRRKQGHVDEGEQQPIVTRMPDVCPLCAVSSDEMVTHLQSHAPIEVCQRCEANEKGWRLDSDGVTHFRPDVSIFYCSVCGRYAPVPITEEVRPADEA